jgi:hypothetical protein
MAKDTLYLLKPSFEKAGELRFCPDCAMMEGYLAAHPPLRDALEIVYVDYARPRAALVERLGEAHQNAPTLILASRARRRSTRRDPVGERPQLSERCAANYALAGGDLWSGGAAVLTV